MSSSSKLLFRGGRCLFFKSLRLPDGTKRFVDKKLFYKDSSPKRKKKKFRLSFDQEFQKNKIKELNKRYNVEMFS